MNLTGKEISFRKNKPVFHPYRILVLLGLLIVGMFVLRGIETEDIQSPFMPTPIPTRTANSFAMEAETQFFAGDLNKAITAYQEAIKLEPENVGLMSDLARIQVYSSELLTTDAEKLARLEEALTTIDRAVEIVPDNSTVHAVRSFVMDWHANPNLVGDERAPTLPKPNRPPSRPCSSTTRTPLPWPITPRSSLTSKTGYRLNSTASRPSFRMTPSWMCTACALMCLKSLGNYGDAIREYQKAIEITPNLTPLYIAIGVNYRQLQQYEIALEYFANAASINEQLGIPDPIPYTAIGKTYTQMGEFFIAGRNVRKALNYDPTNPDIYGQLGMVYFKSRNYEGAIEAFKCSIQGCTAVESCAVRLGDVCTGEEANSPAIVINGLPLSGSTVVYYYTYGSALAALHRESNGYCTEAMEILGEVRRAFGSEPVVMQIVESSESICISLGYSRQ